MSKILLKDRSFKKKRKKIFGILAIFVVLFVAIFYVLIAKSGSWLIENDEFNHVKWAIILDGQSADLERNDFVAKLLAEGKVDSVLILGRRVFRDKCNTDFYADDFMKLGNFDSNAVFIACHDDPSTIAEARTIIPWIKTRKMDSVLLITDPQATKRAARIFRHLSGEKPVYLTADIHNQQYYSDFWVFNRESRKKWLHEWAALANSSLDFLGIDTIAASDSAYYKKIMSFAEDQSIELIPHSPKIQKKSDSKKIDESGSTTEKDSISIEAPSAEHSN